MKNDKLIKISSNIFDLTGEGTEFLTDKTGKVLAEFVDGSMRTTETQDHRENEKTLIIEYS